CQKEREHCRLCRAALMGDPSDVPDRSDPAAVLRWLQQGHHRFLAGQSLHPHSTRERLPACWRH
ncbi:MAG: hypothetical protein VKO00_00375, partial [Cyanobacteriota bacterium]|nr:hypothetical protein [Cyanobacteriota bacterium]